MIGIFDSGSGGLTVLRAIRDVLPSADVLYFGDIKNAPYGSRSHEELSQLTVGALTLLRSRGAERIVSACNSVAATLAMSLFDAFDLAPSAIVEMVGPTVSAFRGSSARVLLAATPATIRSGIYQNAFKMIGKDVVPLPTEDLAGAIEFGKSEVEIQKIIEKALSVVDLKSIDVLVLACTHYPLVQNLFTKALPPAVTIFDPALAVAQRVEKQFWPQEVGEGTTTFLISKDSQPFRTLVQNLFPDADYSIEVLE